MFVLGVVGTPAGGKSTACEYLAGLGAAWINADRIARECLNDPEVVAALTERFGTSILDAEGRVVRGEVAELVFGTEPERRENLRFLESQVHPKTRQEILRRIDRAAHTDCRVVLLDVPLLFEANWHLGCDSIWCIDASREHRLRRSAGRGWDAGELDRREANQLPIETKCRLSQVVVRNDATLEALHENLRCHWSELAKMWTNTGGPSSSRDRHCLSDRTQI
jgi:dephospho-CoA kinase